MGAPREIDTTGLGARIKALPGVDEVRDAARRAGVDAYLVGGAVRDALLGERRADLDVVVEGDQLALVGALGGSARTYDRFGTATVRTGSAQIDVAVAREETYSRPGALPQVRPATLERDLARRDFTVNAIATPLAEPGKLIDPHGGVEDLRACLLRLLHSASFVDDPTRALRAARYGARLDLEPEPETRAALARTDLGTVSADRVERELRLLAAEPAARAGFALLAEWGLLELSNETLELIAATVALYEAGPWQEVAPRGDAVLAAVRGETGAARELAAAEPASASAAVRAARGRPGVALVLARARGGEWIDDYVREWRHVRPQISGRDLIAAGVPQGPAVGRGLAAALEAKLDGLAPTAERELEIALAAARS